MYKFDKNVSFMKIDFELSNKMLLENSEGESRGQVSLMHKNGPLLVYYQSALLRSRLMEIEPLKYRNKNRYTE